MVFSLNLFLLGLIMYNVYIAYMSDHITLAGADIIIASEQTCITLVFRVVCLEEDEQW